MKMKIIIILLSILTATSFTGCKKFLSVSTRDALSGNDFWKSKSDVEAFTLSIYNTLRQNTMVESIYFTAAGELRGAPTRNVTEFDYRFINYLRTNDLRSFISETNMGNRNKNLTIWKNMYFGIEKANILFDQVSKLEDGILSSSDIQKYKAEAVFLRCLYYFFLVRMYSDVPYYTNPFNNTPLPRTDMLTVLKKCSDELESVKNDLDWTNTSSESIAVRASRGSIYALLMHINMWIAGFEESDKVPYYQKVADLGEDMIQNSGGAYELLPLNRSKEIFHGRSKEGIFEIVQNTNSGETFDFLAQFSNYVLAKPYSYRTIPIINYDLNYILKVYPSTEPDLRRDTWFDENLYLNNGKQQMLKFASTYLEGTDQSNQNHNMIVFRYADIFLLTAEALADMEKNSETQTYVNQIRSRAGASSLQTTGDYLKNDIYWERVRELIGEGHYFYDLVRTKRILDGTFAPYPISVDNFRQGAWTWPIDASALNNNPYMTLNQFWR